MSIVERHIETAIPAILDPRVVRGAELLDERMPGWAERIDLDSFVLSSCKRCVLGQLYGDFEIALGRCDIEEAPDDYYGFDIDGRREGRAEYKTLEQDWRLAILSRRTPA